MLEYFLGALTILVAVLVYFLLKIDRKALRDPNYYELTLLLGSGGHTGEMCQLVRGLHFDKTNKINVLIGSSDKASEGFFKNSLVKHLSGGQLQKLKPKLHYHYILRTNQVKQNYITAFFSTTKATLSVFKLIIKQLSNTTHLISNGPGTCLPLFYIFYFLKKVKMSRVKLIFFESWCRVKDLSLSGKLIRPIADEFVVHWPDLAVKYGGVKYFGPVF